MGGYIYNYKPCIFINERIDNPIALLYGDGVNKTADLQCRLKKYCREQQITQTIEPFNHPESTSYDDDLRIARSETETGNSSVQLGSSRTSTSELIERQWAGDNIRALQISPNGQALTFNGTAVNTNINPLCIIIAKSGQEFEANRGLMISADGNTLTFNGPHAVENPSQKRRTSVKAQPYPPNNVTDISPCGVSTSASALKLIIAFGVMSDVGAVAVTLFSYIASVFAGIVIVQLTQQQMGLINKIANFESNILGGVKHATQWVAPALHKVFSTEAGTVGIIHPAIGSALGAGAGQAGAVDRLVNKR
ncbi:MAG: hypothetical protein EZS28_000927 [Streblomastix strix]|uniref:Uncharacterized protein n=1 Tax=Streblomastix strix TaxID=222440 RepID=A0A5J4X8M9_9EUKA|nr:MAG: hypothetical protein EZS28_000927 [Streblomastix strix]